MSSRIERKRTSRRAGSYLRVAMRSRLRTAVAIATSTTNLCKPDSSWEHVMSRTLIYAALAALTLEWRLRSGGSCWQARSRRSRALPRRWAQRKSRRWNSPPPAVGTSSVRRRRRACPGRSLPCPATARASTTARRPRACRSHGRRSLNRIACVPHRWSRRSTSSSPGPVPGTRPRTQPREQRPMRNLPQSRSGAPRSGQHLRDS